MRRTVEWVHKHGDYYVITGVDRNGKKFRKETTSWAYADGVNLWNGRVWLCRDLKRTLVKRVTN